MRTKSPARSKVRFQDDSDSDDSVKSHQSQVKSIMDQYLSGRDSD